MFRNPVEDSFCVSVENTRISQETFFFPGPVAQGTVVEVGDCLQINLWMIYGPCRPIFWFGSEIT